MEGEQDTIRPYSPPGTWLYSQHRLGPVRAGDASGCDQKFRCFHHGCCPRSRTYNCHAQEVHISQPGCPGPTSLSRFLCCGFLAQSPCLTKSIHHASEYLHIFAHTRSLLLRLLHPFHSSKFYFSSRESFFPSYKALRHDLVQPNTRISSSAQSVQCCFYLFIFSDREFTTYLPRKSVL